MQDPLPASLGIDLDGALRRVPERVHRTPLLHSRLLDERVGRCVWLKAESFQRSGSFKARGAFNAVLAGLERGDRRGLLALSSGNHGQAVALAARELGLPAVVVMPETASPVKVAGVRAYGAEVVDQGVTQANREERAHLIEEERGLRFIHPHDDADVIAGQATVGRELADQLLARGVRSALVLVPLGGGGLLSGVSLACRRWLPDATVVGVEPELGNDGQRSLAEGRRIALPEPPRTIADGAAPATLGALCWEVIRDRILEIVTVSEEEILDAGWWLFSRCKLVVEPTGAMTVAAALQARPHGFVDSPGGGDVVCVLSGGNCLPGQIQPIGAGVPGAA